MEPRTVLRLIGRRRIAVGVLVATLAALMMHGSFAVASTPGSVPPFDRSGSSNTCVPAGAAAPATGTCATTTTVNSGTGAFDVAASITSAANGALPVTAYNGVAAQVDLWVTQAITTTPTKITVSISYHIDGATTSAGVSPIPSDLGTGSRAWLSASATMSSCQCTDTQTTWLVDSSGRSAPNQLPSKDITVILTVTNSSGGTITPGNMLISVNGNSAVIADPLTAGTVGASAAGTVTNVTTAAA